MGWTLFVLGEASKPVRHAVPALSRSLRICTRWMLHVLWLRHQRVIMALVPFIRNHILFCSAHGKYSRCASMDKDKAFLMSSIVSWLHDRGYAASNTWVDWSSGDRMVEPLPWFLIFETCSGRSKPQRTMSRSFCRGFTSRAASVVVLPHALLHRCDSRLNHFRYRLVWSDHPRRSQTQDSTSLDTALYGRVIPGAARLKTQLVWIPPCMVGSFPTPPDSRLN
ncbi:hypothetical protein RRG08_023259 [Elysia crispata]|uniref:Uncharacterized protein n=1 Tax=Elysia crispata TaxID=231223 RepID=A0AAE1ACF3_9GAST|nr:hypothetical protein RRG08_023259 [Elysia crispata]